MTHGVESTPYHSPKLHSGPCSSVGMWQGTDRQTHTHKVTQTAVTTIYFASAMPHAKCNEPQSHGPMSNSHCECVDLMHMQSEWTSQRGNSVLQSPLINSDCWQHLTTSTSGTVAKIQKTFCGLESSRMAHVIGKWSQTPIRMTMTIMIRESWYLPVIGSIMPAASPIRTTWSSELRGSPPSRKLAESHQPHSNNIHLTAFHRNNAHQSVLDRAKTNHLLSPL